MDLVVVLVILLVIVIVWRGPKTLPLLGRAFGQGVREARREIDEMKTESAEAEAARERMAEGAPATPPPPADTTDPAAAPPPAAPATPAPEREEPPRA